MPGSRCLRHRRKIRAPRDRQRACRSSVRAKRRWMRLDQAMPQRPPEENSRGRRNRDGGAMSCQGRGHAGCRCHPSKAPLPAFAPPFGPVQPTRSCHHQAEQTSPIQLRAGETGVVTPGIDHRHRASRSALAGAVPDVQHEVPARVPARRVGRLHPGPSER